MSQITFSHQFSHRWLAAPLQVKNAIVQELDDIVKLLDEDTDLEDFEFAIDDLRRYIDTIYNHLESGQGESSNTQGQYDEKPSNATIARTSYPTRSSTIPNKQQSTKVVTIYLDDKDNLEDESQDASSKTDKDLNNDISNATSDDIISNQAIDEPFLQELEKRIDDYLDEELTQMSQDLKAWLREELKLYTRNK